MSALPQIGAKDITFYEGSTPALVMIGSKLCAEDLVNFWFSPSTSPCSMAKGKVQGKVKHVNKASNIKFVTSVSADGHKYAGIKDLSLGVGM